MKALMSPERLVRLFRADFDVTRVDGWGGVVQVGVEPDTPGSEPACRCWRCGALLTAREVCVDEWGSAGCVRPACGECAARG